MTLYGERLWTKDITINVGNEMLLENWDQGLKGSCSGDKMKIIVGPNMQLADHIDFKVPAHVRKELYL